MAFSSRRKKVVRERCAEAQGNICCWCKEPFEPIGPKHLTLDHLRPKAYGGKDHVSNCAAACYDCNQWRGKYTKHNRETVERILEDKATLATPPPPR